MAVQKKGSMNKKHGKVEAKGRDADEDEKKGGTSRAMKMCVDSIVVASLNRKMKYCFILVHSVVGVIVVCAMSHFSTQKSLSIQHKQNRMYQMDAQEMEDRLKEDPNYVPTLEDEVESQRQAMVKKLKETGKQGTPVTEESFRQWQERKRAKHRAEVKKRVETELKKKKGGKGLAVLSGRDLYEYKKDLFKDDDDALALVEEEGVVDQVAAKVETDLFLEGDDDDLSDLDDD